MNLFEELYDKELRRVGFKPCAPKYREGRHFSLEGDKGVGNFWEYSQDGFFLISEMDLILNEDISITFSHSDDMKIIGRYESEKGVVFVGHNEVNPTDINTQLSQGESYSIAYEGKKSIKGMSVVLLPSFLEELDVKFPGHSSLSFSTESILSIPNDIFGEIKHFRGIGLSAKLFYESKILELLSYLYRYECEKSSEISEYDYIKIKEIMAYIDTNISASLNVELLSEMACMSCTKFKQIFKTISRLTTSEYITKSRMQNATRLLTESNLGVAEVAHSVGYKKVAAFSTAYRTYFGELPSKTKKLSR